MKDKTKGEHMETEQSMNNPSQSALKKALAWFRSMESKRRVQIIVGIVAVIIILTIAVVRIDGIGSKKPQGTYVSYIAGMKVASYEFKGNNVEYFMLGSTNKGTFQMEDDTVLIVYEDGGKDQFTYNAETDELNMGSAVTLVKEK